MKLPKTELWIDGRWQSAQSGKKFKTVNPATEQVIAEVAEGDEKDIELAVKAARKSFDQGPWPRMKASEREKILRKIAELIRRDAESLAELETADCGKPISDSRESDIPCTADAFDYYAGWCDKLSGETLPADPDYFSYTLREPLGVIGAITPWNFPMALAAQKIAPALAAGNTVVLKPAEQTPLTALRLAEISAEAGLPEGVLNIITGFGPAAGAALVRHPDVDGITFTGECRTGQEIMKNAAGTLKRLAFELGGKSANIVFADADLEKAAAFSAAGIFFNQGQVCCAGSRLFVEEKIGKDFTQALVEMSKRWQPGDPMDPKTKMGAMVSREQLDKVLEYVEIGRGEGAQLAIDGRKTNIPKGYFMAPTLFTGVTNQMRLAQEEIFGPVLAQMPFKNAEEALAGANRNSFGLAAAVFTRDVQKAHKAAAALKAGTVWVNCYGTFDHAMPFGGYKMSGNTREGSIHTFDFYTQRKAVWVNLK